MNTKPKEQKKTRQFTMWVSEGELRELRRLAQKDNVSMSQYIRNALMFSVVTKQYKIE